MTDALLIELLTEELPPKSLESLSQALCKALTIDLKQDGLLSDASVARSFATPRRLAVSITHVLDEAPSHRVQWPGPSTKAGIGPDGKPTPALLGFARKHGVSVDQLIQVDSPKGTLFAYQTIATGTKLATNLDRKVTAALESLPTSKLMRWGEGASEFARPIHSAILLHGNSVIGQGWRLLGALIGNHTLGHRFMSQGEIAIQNAADYEATLEREGKVIASFEKRRTIIDEKLRAAAKMLNADLQLEERAALLDEVTALVEWPAVYAGEFEPEFLAVPQECLILTMQQNQKYFPLFDDRGRLLPKFLIVSNMEVDDPSAIIDGNQRVVRARLADAKFFYDQDRKLSLAQRVPQLGNVVHHNKLGTQLERVQRLVKLAGTIAQRLGADPTLAERAAYLCKADLLTGMVGEFPEIQGIMGMYYARHDGEPDAVARAIEEHYHPRFANDTLPADNVSSAVALADKLDTLIGIYGVGLIPTGDKDPFALRRHGLGVLRILFEKPLPLDLKDLLMLAKSLFPQEVLADSVAVDVYAFLLERLRNYLRERDYDVLDVDAVLSQNPTHIDLVQPRLDAVGNFRRLPQSASLAVANKRIRNILKKTETPDKRPDVALLAEPAERALFDAMTALEPQVASLIANEDYDDALRLLASARQAVDRFFDEVLVMCEEPLLRANRLALLRQLNELMNQVADISKLAV
jgi:glycyl-tRNA synthetase beta chain